MNKTTRLLTQWEERPLVFVAKFMADYIKDKCKIMVTCEWSLTKTHLSWYVGLLNLQPYRPTDTASVMLRTEPQHKASSNRPDELHPQLLSNLTVNTGDWIQSQGFMRCWVQSPWKYEIYCPSLQHIINPCV